MEWAWNVWALPPLVAGLAGMGMAFPTYFAAPRRAQNLLLALFFFVMGGGHMAQGVSRLSLTPDAGYAGELVYFWLWTCSLPLYLLFISTIDAPLVAALRRRAVRAVLVAITVATPVLWLMAPSLYIEGVRTGSFETPWYAVGGPLLALSAIPHLAVSLTGLAAAISAHRSAAPDSVARERARGYAIAFGVADAIMCVLILLAAPLSPNHWEGWLAIMSKPEATNLWEAILRPILAAGWAVQFFVLVLLFGYAVLHTHLFDIDIKIKWTIRRGTLAGIFLAAFFVVAQIAQNFLTESMGWAAGGVIAGLLLFGLAPLQRFAERVSDAAMPRVDSSSSYVASRKFFVYRGAVESALEDGQVTAKERAMLQRLQRELGIDAHDAELIEADVLGKGSHARPGVALAA